MKPLGILAIALLAAACGATGTPTSPTAGSTPVATLPIPAPSPTPSPTPDPTPSPVPVPAPSPAPTPTPSPSPAPPQTFALTGTIRNVSTHAGISSAVVEIIQGSGAGRTVTTDATGAYRLDQLAAGAIRIQGWADGYLAKFGDTVVTKDQTLDVELTTSSSPGTFTLKGTVTDTVTGKLIAGVDVDTVEGQNPSRTTRTYADGIYIFDHMKPGTMKIRARATGYDVPIIPVALTSDQTMNIRLTPLPPPPTNTFSGFVRDGRGAPVADVILQIPGGDQPHTDSSGHYSFGSAESTLTVSVHPPSGYQGYVFSRQCSNALTLVASAPKDIIVKRITSIDVAAVPATVQLNTTNTNTRIGPVTIGYDTGETGQPLCTAQVTVTSSNPLVLAVTDSSVYGFSPGTANVTAQSAWGGPVFSRTVTVLPLP